MNARRFIQSPRRRDRSGAAGWKTIAPALIEPDKMETILADVDADRTDGG
jgi:hypothetical protein